MPEAWEQVRYKYFALPNERKKPVVAAASYIRIWKSKCSKTIFLVFKGQIKPQAAVDPPKKRTKMIFLKFFTLHGKKQKFVPLFFVRIYGAQI